MGDYEASAASLNRHPVPEWFEDAKLGIFIHWGLFSVPGFAPRLEHVSDAFTQHYPLSAVMTPYTEWYDNAIRVPESPSAAHHREHFGDAAYSDFRRPFEAGLENWDPADWARLFKRAGARYVVLVSKHHDGYCLWPSEVPHPLRPGWHSERDIVGELADAVRSEGMRFGLYYSGGIDWSFNPNPVRTFVQFIASTPGGPYPAYADAQVRELIARYSPSVLWNDISWPAPKQAMFELMAHYYESVPEGVINDRWMHRNWLMRLLSNPRLQKWADTWLERRITKQAVKGDYQPGIIPPEPAHYDFRTPEYTSFDAISERKWEATRGMSPSFGFNRLDREEHYERPEELLFSFIDSVSKNGNLLLNVGPTGEDATIPSFQRERLEFLGEWLGKQGRAIFDTRPFEHAEGQTGEDLPVRFTRRGDCVHAILLGTPSASEFTLRLPCALPSALDVRWLAGNQGCEANLSGEVLHVRLKGAWPHQPAHAFLLCGGPEHA